MRYALKIAYDGTDFCGWQIQPNGRTVQQELERAVSEAFGVNARVCASGRTDSGVHAAGQVAHVDLPIDMDGKKVADALNAHLCAGVSVLSSCAAPEGFDANRSAKRKTYRYSLYISRRRNPLCERFAVRVDSMPDVIKMREAAAYFVGRHDFKAYCASGSQVMTTEREVYSLDITEGGGKIEISVCGNGFLYNMVRTIAGTLLWYSYGKLTAEDIALSLKGDRTRVGKTMPPNGLCLMDVDYGICGLEL